jgi:hypothetical protein
MEYTDNLPVYVDPGKYCMADTKAKIERKAEKIDKES